MILHIFLFLLLFILTSQLSLHINYYIHIVNKIILTC
nr:MAG TPA: hypothetical protein [Caudoviricetes sp.]